MPCEERLNDGLRLFFDEHAAKLPDNPTLEQLCAASCKETRLWARPEVYADLMDSIRQQLDLKPHHRLLEVGCAAGFLAVGLAPLCAQYVGVDLSPMAVKQASRLRLPNAKFSAVDGESLPFAGGTFDRVISYDVFTNFPGIEVARQVAVEMLRVTAPGGVVLIGALPDKAAGDKYFQHGQEVTRQLEVNYGPKRELNSRRPSWLVRLRHWYARRVRKVEPSVINYLFDRAEFRKMGAALEVETAILEPHKLNPYAGYRYNVAYKKRAAA